MASATLATSAAERPAAREHYLPYELDGGPAARAAIGLITLATDLTIEREVFNLLDLPGVGVFANRLFYDGRIEEASLKAMERGIADAARLIAPSIDLDVVAFGCTSGTMYIGAENVAARVREARPGAKSTSPTEGALAAFRAFGAERIALLTPYQDDVNRAMHRFFEGQGIAVPVMGAYGIARDLEVCQVTPESIKRTALELGRSDRVDAVFVSCTGLRAAGVVAELERELGKPVTSSNHAMAWHALRLAGYDDEAPGRGSLFTRPLP